MMLIMKSVTIIKGNELFKQKKFKEAIECYSRSIALSPTAVAYANRAMAYLKIRRQVLYRILYFVLFRHQINVFFFFFFKCTSGKHVLEMQKTVSFFGVCLYYIHFWVPESFHLSINVHFNLCLPAFVVVVSHESYNLVSIFWFSYSHSLDSKRLKMTAQRPWT